MCIRDRLYAAGRIPGSFMRREGRPGERAILTSRVVDRPLRPLFPKEMRNDVCITMTVMSLDPDCSPETVSYTHLDVYKRQQRSCICWSCSWAVSARCRWP